MKSVGFVVLSSFLFASILCLVGGYMTVSNIISPQGNLFEGVVILSFGFVVALLLTIMATLGKTIQIFTDVYTQQLEMQKTMVEFYSTQSKPKTIGEILGGLPKMGTDSITITNLETGETTTAPFAGGDPLAKIGEILGGFNIPNNPKKSFNVMSIEQLEKELSDAVKKDDFEKAQEIRDIIRSKRDNEKKD